MTTRIVHNSGKEDWYTPPHLLDAARSALGGEFDLDPASSPRANELVHADRFFTREDDGLSKPWNARRLWLNPPFANRAIVPFVNKLWDEFHERRIEAAIILTNNGTETKWAQALGEMASAICLLSRRVAFLDESLTPRAGALQGQVVWLLTHDAARDWPTFGNAFFQLGSVWER